MLTLELANKTAHAIVAALTDVCEQIEIVGSIRRKRPYVHDIDLVVIPRYEERQTHSLFPTNVSTCLLEERIAELVLAGRIKLKSSGNKMKRFQVGSEILVDIYVASRENWSALCLIRTGSKSHNIYLCNLARTLGMQLKADGSGLFRNGTMIARDSEESIFSALGLSYVPPEAREGLDV
jgi:DNA polymerase (family X)